MRAREQTRIQIKEGLHFSTHTSADAWVKHVMVAGNPDATQKAE